MKKSIKNILAVMSKELRRFLGDRRMLITIILPGILIYILYTLMGNVMTNIVENGDDEVCCIYVENLPSSVENALASSNLTIEYVEKLDNPIEKVQKKTLDLYAVFPNDFDCLGVDFNCIDKNIPEVKLYYNSASSNSQKAYTIMEGILNSIESSVFNLFDINASDDIYDVATTKDRTGTLLSSLMPMLLLSMLFSSCMSVAPESIAGEKERGTLSTLLVTPMRRSELAIGKIAALSIVAVLSGMCSFVGTMMSLPSLIDSEAEKMDTAIYGIHEYSGLLIIILSTVLVFVSIISILSALADSVKAASSMNTPLMAIIMLLSLTTSFLPQIPKSTACLIPLYNSIRCIGDIFSFDYSTSQILLTALINLTVTGISVITLTRLFNSEKVMFGK